MMLWLDLETTGLDPKTECVLEVAAIATTDALVEVSRFHAVIDFTGVIDDEVVREMHHDNGLLAACMKSAVTEEQAGEWLVGWVENLLYDRADRAMTLAGSGVAHFDRPWIQEKWPDLAQLLTYWVIDIGVMRRGNRLVNIAMPEPHEHKAHRAMQDIEQHLMEMRQTAMMHQ